MMKAPGVVVLSSWKYCGKDKFAPLEPVASQSAAFKESPELQQSRIYMYFSISKKENSTCLIPPLNSSTN
jgi:hypothetical protein